MTTRRNRLGFWVSPWTWKDGKYEIVYCYKCGAYGYLGPGTVSSTYYPKKGLDECGTVYRPRPGTKGITYGRYRIRYIRHQYSSEEYHKGMERYRNHEIKSWPNGQTRHYVQTNVKFQYNAYAKCLLAFCDYNPYTQSKRPYKGLTKIWKPTPKSMRYKYEPEPTKPLPPQERPLLLAVQALAL